MSFIVGLGTGRCGSHSLCELLKLQRNSFFTHEFGDKPKVHWNSTIDPKSLFAEHMLSEKKFFGDVGFYHLPHCREYVEAFPDAKFIILKRDKNETILSFEKKVTFRNHWMHGHGKFKPCPWGWDPCFPKFDADSRKQAISLYYDHYYSECQKLDQSKCFWIQTPELNNEEKVVEMLIWCGFKNPIFKKFHENRT